MRFEPGIRLTESEYPPGLVLPPHRHEEASVALVIAGRVEETAERRTSASSSCSVVFKPAGVVHGNRFGPEGARLFNVTWEAGAQPPALATRGYAWMHGGGTCDVALRLYREFLRGDEPAHLAMEGLVLELAAGEEIAPRGTPPRWLRDVQELLRERFSESLRVADLAQAAGVHPVHLARVFRQVEGCTPGEYLRRVRLQWALRQLASGSLSVADVAQRAGFADQSHFTRALQRQVGFTPAHFRRTARAPGGQVANVQDRPGPGV